MPWMPCATPLRPIAMSTLTTVFGLAPLVFLAGEGTELYRGVGVIVMFGLPGKVAVLFGGKQFPAHNAPSLFSETPSSAGSAARRRAPAARVPSSHPWRPVLQAW